MDNHFGLFTGIHADKFTFYYHSRRFTSGTESKITENFITIPFILRVVTNKRRDVSFYANAGLQLMILAKLTDNYGTGTTNDKTGFQTTSVALVANFGLEIPVSKNLDINFGPDIIYQLQNNFNDGYLKGRLRALGGRITVGYCFSK